MEWLDESERTLDSEVEIANDPDKIKTQLAQHKVTEFNIMLTFFNGNWNITSFLTRNVYSLYSVRNFLNDISQLQPPQATKHRLVYVIPTQACFLLFCLFFSF